MPLRLREGDLPDPLLRPLLEMDRLVSDESDLELSRPGRSGDGLSSGGVRAGSLYFDLRTAQKCSHHCNKKGLGWGKKGDRLSLAIT